MVFTYTGIARVLWGSLPSEHIVHDDKRAINSSQHTLTGRFIWEEKPIMADWFAYLKTLSQATRMNHTSAGLFTVTVVWWVQRNRPIWSFKKIDRRQRKCSSTLWSSSSSAIFQCTPSISSGILTNTHDYCSLTNDRSFRYVYVYAAYTQRSNMENQRNSSDTIECFQPKLVPLERTGTIKYVTISALISHFLPYFNSSINPIIYNIMSGKYSVRLISLIRRRV